MNYCEMQLVDVVNIKTGKLNSNAAVEKGEYPFYTCAPSPLRIDKYKYDQAAILLAGNNAEGNFHINYFEGKFEAYQRTYIIDSKNEDKYDLKYLFYALKECLHEFKLMSQGTSTKFLTMAILNGFKLNIPDINEQRKIAGILSSLDQKISNNEAINRNLLDQGRVLYEELIAGYEVNSKLGDLIKSIETGKRPKGGAQEVGVPSIGAEKIECFGVYNYSTEKFIDDDFYRNLKKGHVLSGDVLLYKDGAYTGKTSMALDGFPHEKCAINEHVYKLNTLNNLYQFFLYFTLDNDKIKDYIYTLASSKAAQPGLNQNELRSVDIVLPEESVLLEFENRVSDMMHLIASNAKESRSLSIIRDTLLPKLMSGELDVSELEV
ncbi:restriction endonuclease subunit S [Pectinatus brassicae]|uniref:Type I restriction enzyme S subunit n=1 Tax=Pectinatus brassicae TaxID=862415 RepID=A0A840UKD0_9FIRM|nr:restriction endonuclease subunit S [Pectinatus brassicae]MBB5336117.1 type I restriction enzyme S subunit [Pectinatus brassicae]